MSDFLLLKEFLSYNFRSVAIMLCVQNLLYLIMSISQKDSVLAMDIGKLNLPTFWGKKERFLSVLYMCCMYNEADASLLCTNFRFALRNFLAKPTNFGEKVYNNCVVCTRADRHAAGCYFSSREDSLPNKGTYKSQKAFFQWQSVKWLAERNLNC